MKHNIQKSSIISAYKIKAIFAGDDVHRVNRWVWENTEYPYWTVNGLVFQTSSPDDFDATKNRICTLADVLT